jgi:methyltransferase
MFYPIFLIASLIEILLETAISMRNSARLIQRGAIEISPVIFRLMALLYIWMYVASFCEWFAFRRPLTALWIISFGSLFLAAKLLKYFAVRALGALWTMRVLIIPGTKVVATGPYKWMRHPNYVAVLLEIAATTLIGKSFFTFLAVFSLFCIVLIFRIRGEEAALRKFTNF